MAGSTPQEGAAAPARRALALGAVLAATALGYTPALRGPRTLDDDQLARLPATGDLLPLLPGAVVGRSRAVADLSFALQDPGSGDTLPLHLGNLAAHLAVVAVGYALARQLQRRAGWDRPGTALAAAALFGLHPLASSAVAYLVQRAEVLSSLGAAGAVLLALRSETSAWPVRVWAAATAALLLGLGAKGVPVTACATYALASWAFPPRGAAPRWQAIAARALPWAAASAAFAVGLLSRTGGTEDAGAGMPEAWRDRHWLSQGRAILETARLGIWPSGQSVDPGFASSTSLDLPAALAWVAVAGMAAAAASGLGRRRHPAVRLAAFGLAWFLLHLAPVAAFPLVDPLFEYRAYLALFGLALAAAALGSWALERLPSKARSGAAAAALALCLGGLGTALFERARLWGDPRALWEDAVAKAPRKARPHATLAEHLRAAGDLDGAARELRAASELSGEARRAGDPALGPAIPAALVAAVRALEAGRPGEAVRLLEAGLAGAPPEPRSLALYARALLASGRPGEAELRARQALWIDARQPAAHTALAEALRAQGRRDEALRELLAAAQLSGDEPAASRALAAALAEAGRLGEACAVLAGLVTHPGTAGEAAALGCRPGAGAGPP